MSGSSTALRLESDRPLSRAAPTRVPFDVDTDRDIVDGLRRGDPRAFDRAFDRYRARIFAFLLRMTRRPELADELLQETFVRLASHATRLSADTSLRAWLFTVARNLWRSHARWAWLDGERLVELAFRGLGSQEPDPFDQIVASRSERLVEAALAELSAANREVALLVLHEGFEPAEAAVILGIKPEAVRQRLARVRASLATALGEPA